MLANSELIENFEGLAQVLKRYGAFACHGTGEGFFRPKEVRGRKVSALLTPNKLRAFHIATG
jgi:hypothetical protein